MQVLSAHGTWSHMGPVMFGCVEGIVFALRLCIIASEWTSGVSP